MRKFAQGGRTAQEEVPTDPLHPLSLGSSTESPRDARRTPREMMCTCACVCAFACVHEAMLSRPTVQGPLWSDTIPQLANYAAAAPRPKPLLKIRIQGESTMRSEPLSPSKPTTQ